MCGTKSHGCGEHWRTSENAQDEILHNRFMKSRLFVVTGNGDKDINITSNGGVILFPTPHGNQNMHFSMMAKYWLTTKNTTTFNFSFVSI